MYIFYSHKNSKEEVSPAEETGSERSTSQSHVAEKGGYGGATHLGPNLQPLMPRPSEGTRFLSFALGPGVNGGLVGEVGVKGAGCWTETLSCF